MFPRRLTGVVIAVVLAAPAPLRAAAQATTPTEDRAARQRQDIDAAVSRLGSADPAEREAASRFLWSLGEPARPALQQAAEGDDIEAARRAREILRLIQYGISPDTPKVVSDLLEMYRQAVAQPDRVSVAPAVSGLAGAGPAGLRVLTRLWQDETDEGRRRSLAQALAEPSRPAAAALLAQGDGASALELLTAAADAPTPWGAAAVRDLAALLLLRDGGAGLDARIGALKPLVADTSGEKNSRQRSARLLAYLLRTRGDLAGARWAAEQAGESALIELLMVESAQWKELAERSLKRPNLEESVEDLGYAAAFHRLAGDDAGLDTLSGKLVALVARHPDEAMTAAESLFLNDRPDEGFDLLLKYKAFSEAAEVLAPRMRYDELLALADRLRGQKEPDAPAVEARAAAVRHALGDVKAANDSLERLVAEAAARKPAPEEFARYVAFAEAANAMGRADLVEECVIRGVTIAGRNDDLSDLFEAADLRPGERAGRWWKVLREKYKEPARVTLGRLRSITKGELAPAQMEALARAAADLVRRTELSVRDEAVADVGDALVAAGHKEAAANYFRWLAQRPPPTPVALVRLGDLEAEAGNWDAAAAHYGKACELDHTDPLPLLLRGWALSRIGREKEGSELVERAHVLPLADEAARHALMVELERRQMRDDARRERELILRTAAFQSWHQSDALRRAGDEAYEKQDYLAAADLWDRAFLDNQSRSTRFARLWANFAMPALIHRSRALGLMRKGDFPAAGREAELSMHYSPSDADAVIAFVNELDRLGKKAEADELYRRHTAPYRALCEGHPNSGQAHNQLAWAQAKCRRDLDDALAHARRAVELEPTSTACLDTLAETHFQRGEVQEAVEVMNRCVELEPKDKRHQEQLERFNAALKK
jgi:tetratricopeptide (TPR) repeat protein